MNRFERSHHTRSSKMMKPLEPDVFIFIALTSGQSPWQSPFIWSDLEHLDATNISLRGVLGRVVVTVLRSGVSDTVPFRKGLSGSFRRL